MRKSRAEMEISVKNNANALNFSQTNLLPICAEASQIGFDATIFAQIPMLRFGMEDYYERMGK